jgi:uncharacterized membrane protein
MADVGKSSTGLQANLAGLLAYALGLVTGLVFFLIEKESKFVKFHAMQSIAFSVVMFITGFILAFIPFIGIVGGAVLNLAGLVVWIILMVKAYQGELFKLPVLGDFAEKQVGGPAAS